MKRILWNETGQMTIFVALIFQVLFVFFAMVINIGLLVHDKINLQNAVDFGAYYAAQRQAEILNEIAHVNYQIRQDNKLLAWRYRVLATMGRTDTDPPPVMSALGMNIAPDILRNEIPSVCVAMFYWHEMTALSSLNENACKRQYGAPGVITRINTLPIIAPFVPGVLAGAALISVLRDKQIESLRDASVVNWAFSAEMMQAYRYSLGARKAVIAKLRTNLVSENMVDQNNQSVSQGVLNTIKKNLTVSNGASFEDDQFKFVNGLASPACAGANKDGDPTLKEIRTQPLILYTQIDPTSARSEQVRIDEVPSQGLGTYDPKGHLQEIIKLPSGSIPISSPDGLTAPSLGFEKNPWCMAYVAVQAKSKPRKPFAPLGQAVELEARAFAQPFGGRIGPWYRSQWQPGAPMSSGDRVNPASTPRLVGDGDDGGTDVESFLPNYSRYPGDVVGLRSQAAQASTRSLMKTYGGRGGTQLSFGWYAGFELIPATGDPLAFDLNSPNPNQIAGNVSAVRLAEQDAVAPDLFDAVYYSIDSHYAANYKALNANGARFQGLSQVFGQATSVPPDIGSRNGTGVAVDIQDQIVSAMKTLDGTLLSSGVLGYFISKPEHLLTGWAPNSVSNFDFPKARFGTCTHFVSKAQYMIPGGCTNGGRVGYSVRIISRSHLTGNWDGIGGAGQSGKILNPEAVSAVSN